MAMTGIEPATTCLLLSLLSYTAIRCTDCFVYSTDGTDEAAVTR